MRFPQTTAPFRLLVHVFALWGAYPTGYIPSFDEVWFDFRYDGHRFSVNNQFNDFWFFHNPGKKQPNEETLLRIAKHFAKFADQ